VLVAGGTALGQVQETPAPSVILAGERNRPTMVADEYDALRTPIRVFSDREVEEFVPDNAGPAWVQWNGEQFVDTGKYRTMLYVYDKKKETNSRTLLEVDTRNDTVRVMSGSGGGEAVAISVASTSPGIARAVAAVTAIVEAEVSKYKDAIGSEKYGPAPVATTPVSKPDRQPQEIYSVEPEYSQEARELRLSGTVLVSLVVDENGNPQQVRVVRRMGHGLDEQAVKAVQQFRFKPAVKDGKPVAARITVAMTFRIYP
jgi:TonB family protein